MLEICLLISANLLHLAKSSIENAWRDTAAPRSFSCVWEAPAICLVSVGLLQWIAPSSVCWGSSSNLLGSFKVLCKKCNVFLRLGSSVSLDWYVFSNILGNTLRLCPSNHFQNMLNIVDI